MKRIVKITQSLCLQYYTKTAPSASDSEDMINYIRLGGTRNHSSPDEGSYQRVQLTV